MLIIEYADMGDLLSYLRSRNTATLQRDVVMYQNIGRQACLEITTASKNGYEDDIEEVSEQEMATISWQIAKGMRHIEQMKVCVGLIWFTNR